VRPAPDASSDASRDASRDASPASRPDGPRQSARAPDRVTRSTWLQVFVSRRIAAMLVLGFASGLPLALSAGTLQAWLTVEGVDLTTIGFFALAGLPYTFKFVWAPLADRFEPPALGRRRGWLLITQGGLAAACLIMGMLDPRDSIVPMAACAVAIAFLSASQDIVFDAYRSDLLDESERGAGAAVSVLGYRLAMLVSGGLAMVLADTVLGWPGTYRLMAVLFALLFIASLFVPRVSEPEGQRSPVGRELRGFAVMLLAGVASYLILREAPWEWLGSHRLTRLLADTLVIVAALVVAIWAARRAGFPSFVEPWDAFFSRERAMALLALIVLYKLGDAFAGALSTSFLIRGAGFSAAEVGAVNKVLGLAATIVGVIAGGAWLARKPLHQSLILFGVLQALSNLGYWLVAIVPGKTVLMAVAVGLENLCGGLGTAAFVAFLMALTDRRFSAAQFALLSALSAVGRVYVGPVAAILVEMIGWPTFFLVTVVTALPGLFLVWRLAPAIARL
jgi:PAT family beta-lactamase induction signal transducer AmpG